MLFELFASTLRLAVPLIFAALGGMMSERSGVINIALEGFMLIGAFFGVHFALMFHSPWLGLVGAVLAGGIGGLLYVGLVLVGRGDQIVMGTGFNMLAIGLTPQLCKLFYDTTNGTPSLPIAERFHWEPMLIAVVLPFVLHLWLKYTRSGLWLDFAGANPKALQTQGVSVGKVRVWAVTMSGALAASGGATLTIYLSSSFARNISAGRGFIALAALILGRWRPIPALLGCLLFGFADALQIRMQGAAFGGGTFPVQLIQIMPYAVTLVVLFSWAGGSRAPKALGSRE